MQTVEIKRNHLQPPMPMDNPFNLYGMEVESIMHGSGTYLAKTGLLIGLPSNIGLEVEAFADNVFILDHRLTDEGLVLVVMIHGVLGLNQALARARLIVRETAKVRFIERSSTGGRIIRGDGVKIENSSETGDAES